MMQFCAKIHTPLQSRTTQRGIFQPQHLGNLKGTKLKARQKYTSVCAHKRSEDGPSNLRQQTAQTCLICIKAHVCVCVCYKSTGSAFSVAYKVVSLEMR